MWQIGSALDDLVSIGPVYLDSLEESEAGVLHYNFWRAMLWVNEGETSEGKCDSAGIPWGQHDVALNILWLAKDHYRNGHCGEEAVEQMARLVNRVSGKTFHVSNIVQVMKMSPKDKEAWDMTCARLGARTGERKRAKMLSCFCDAAKAFCSTERGGMGSGPLCMRSGDLIDVLQDARLPCLLLQVLGQSNQFQFLGEIYIEGFAFGEALQEFPPGWTTVNLV